MEKNQAWYLGAYASVISLYLQAMREMAQRKFFEAWCTLERVEISLNDLKKNAGYALSDLKIDLFQELVTRWQSTYPYSVFLSPEFHIGHETCSICSQRISPHSHCGHRIGRVYGGRICYRIARDMKVVGMSLVHTPVQKYSVVHPWKNDPDRHNLVEYVFRLIGHPFSHWDLEWTYRFEVHPLEFSDGNACPCGSALVYSSCCKARPGIRRRHVQVLLDQMPSPDIPLLVLPPEDDEGTEGGASPP